MASRSPGSRAALRRQLPAGLMKQRGPNNAHTVGLEPTATEPRSRHSSPRPHRGLHLIIWSWLQNMATYMHKIL